LPDEREALGLATALPFAARLAGALVKTADASTAASITPITTPVSAATSSAAGQATCA